MLQLQSKSSESLPLLAQSPTERIASLHVGRWRRLREEREHQELDNRFGAHPWAWCTHQSEGTQTFDEHWKEKGTSPYAAFPDKPYLKWLMEQVQKHRRLFVPKSREMIVSWLVIAYAVWMCKWFERTRALVQAQKEEKVIDLICGRGNAGYARTLYEQQPPWLQARHPLTKAIEDMPGNLLTWANGSTLQGVPKGADQVRQYHPTVAIFDEAAHLDEFQESYGAADPVCSQIIAVSSATPSWFGDVVEESV